MNNPYLKVLLSQPSWKRAWES